ncbi:ABC-2 transporter permease [Clostridiaceae bacterium]|nr:ABC-2 transporter permease [Clostridiaceae bacterium]RKI14374.1 ABC-2 transporter permease [bacterium 1XD21-70]
MSNIWKSVKLDFSLVEPYTKTILFALVLPSVFAAINRSLLTGISFAMCFMAMTTGYTFSVTERNSMERLYGILPVRKSEIVIGRYIFIIIMGLIALLFSLIAHPILLVVLGETIRLSDIGNAAAMGIFLFALYTVFLLPGYYKLGSIKGRMFLYIPAACFLATLSFITMDPAKNSTLFFTVIRFPAISVILAIAAAAAMYILSILVSVKIVQNKEM